MRQTKYYRTTVLRLYLPFQGEPLVSLSTVPRTYAAPPSVQLLLQRFPVIRMNPLQQGLTREILAREAQTRLRIPC